MCPRCTNCYEYEKDCQCEEFDGERYEDAIARKADDERKEKENE